MKRFYTFIAMVMLTLTAMATDYTDSLSVSLNGDKPTKMQDVVINLDKNADGTYNLTLKDFSFSGMNVGTIKLTNLAGTTSDGVTTIDTKQKTKITGGLLGPLLGEIEITLKAKFTSEKLYAVISIPVKGVGDVVCVYGAESTVTRISTLPILPGQKADAVYDLNGRRVSTMVPGQVYVIRHADGTSVKTVAK